MRLAFRKPKPEKAAEPAGPTVSVTPEAIAEVSRQAARIGRDAADLSGVVEDLATTTREDSSTFKSFSERMQAMLGMNRTITQASERSRAHARDAATAVAGVADGVSSVIDTLREVASAAREITQIAMHTRLVAFNASVEAKRAGEAGKGFGVVAEAVKDLAAKVEQSSKHIMQTVTQLDARVGELAREIRSDEDADGTPGAAPDAGQGTFQAALRRSEASIDESVQAAQRNLELCNQMIAEVGQLAARVDGTAQSLTRAQDKAAGFVKVSESLMEIALVSGVQTEDAPYIALTIENAQRIQEVFESAVSKGEIALADLFDDRYQPIPGTNPEQHTTRFTGFCDRVLPMILEPAFRALPRITAAVCVDRNGYIPTHNAQYSKAQGRDPVWNAANCRNRRIFKVLGDRDPTRRFQLSTYRRDMGGGNFVMSKRTSAPIFVGGRFWGVFGTSYDY